MLQELSDILQHRVHPAIYDGIEALTQVLEKYQAIGYKDRIIRLKMEGNEHEQLTLADEARTIVFDQVLALLKQMQIDLDIGNMSIEKLASILDCLLFEPNDNDYEFLTAVNAGEEAVDTLCNVLAIHLACEPEELMEYVLGASGDVVLAIKERVERNLAYTAQGEDGVQSTVRLLNQHQKLVGEKLTVGMESLQAGREVGSSAEEMVQAASERLAVMQPEDLADNLLSIAILAKTPRDALRDEVMHFVEGMVDDPFVVQKAYKRVNARLNDMPENTP
ncbi:hypothetical protein D3C76_154700 [compost metagenome]